MAEEAVIQILLGATSVQAIAGDRVFPSQLPDAVTYPAVVVQRAGGAPEYDMRGEAGIGVSRVQVDCYAESYAQMVDLKRAVRALLSGYQGPAGGLACRITASFCINDLDLPVGETERAGPRVRRRMLEFRIWSKES